MKALAFAILAASATAAHAAPLHQQLPRADGSLIHYTLDTPPGPPAGLILLAQGSGCAPGAGNANLAIARAAFPAHIALIVEKYGITPDAPITDGYSDCPPAFHGAYTISQRVDDYVRVLDHLAASGPLVLLGGSEGGLAMAILASRVAPAATILLSSATGMSFGDMVRSTVPPEGHPTIDAGFAAARANPDSAELFAGSTYRFWADILDHRSLDYMLDTATPFLLIQGGRDTSAPIAAARLTTDAFAAAGLCTLTYWEFSALDHGMADPAGASHMPAILTAAAHWAADPSPAC